MLPHPTNALLFHPMSPPSAAARCWLPPWMQILWSLVKPMTFLPSLKVANDDNGHIEKEWNQYNDKSNSKKKQTSTPTMREWQQQDNRINNIQSPKAMSFPQYWTCCTSWTTTIMAAGKNSQVKQFRKNSPLLFEAYQPFSDGTSPT